MFFNKLYSRKVISKITNKIPELGEIFNKSYQKNNNERGDFIHSNKVNRVKNKKNKNKILKKILI